MPSVCRAGVRRRVFKARVVGSKLTFSCGLETYGYWLASLIAASYRTALFACRRAPSLNRSHVTHLHGGSPYDLTPTHYGIQMHGAMASLQQLVVDEGPLGSEHPALKAACDARGISLVGFYE